MWLTAYLNAAVDIDTSDLDASEGRWGIGVDGEVATRFMPAAGTAPLFGIDPGRPDYYDLSVGGRVNL